MTRVPDNILIHALITERCARIALRRLVAEDCGVPEELADPSAGELRRVRDRARREIERELFSGIKSRLGEAR